MRRSADAREWRVSSLGPWSWTTHSDGPSGESRTTRVWLGGSSSRVEPAVDDGGRLIVPDVDFFGMTAGSGEHYTMGRRVGNIGMTVRRSDIK
ncbi:hypothetical protein [Candidatus Palauibacter sp.]|uniref:hypothetical protein n=1 Tax=Candidatus Palauibacter sp. TaxID=3101350 RepID=UPI003B5C2166